MVGQAVAFSRLKHRWTIRPLLLLVHRWSGLALAGVLVVAGLTGSILAFDDELDAWLNPQLFRASPGIALPLERLLEAVEKDDPDATVTWISFPTSARGTLQVGVKPRDIAVPLRYDQVFINPANASVLGRRGSDGCCFASPVLVPFLFRLHSSLALGETGRWIMGGAALLWSLDCFVALWLTFPRSRPFFKKWRQAWGIKRVSNPFRLVFDIHRAGGLWCWILLLLVAVSGVALTLRSEVFLPVLRLVLPVTPDLEAAPESPSPAIDWSGAVARANAALPGRRPVVAYYLPSSGIYGVTMAPPSRGAYAGLGPDVVFVAAEDGRILRTDEAGRGRVGDTVLALQYPLHSGRVGGLASRLLVSVIGLAVAVLSMTGYWLWWRKRHPANLRRKLRPMAASKPIASDTWSNGRK